MSTYGFDPNQARTLAQAAAQIKIDPAQMRTLALAADHLTKTLTAPQMQTLSEAAAQLTKSLDTEHMRSLATAASAIKVNPAIAQLTVFTNDNRDVLMQLSKQFEGLRVPPMMTAQLPAVRNWALDLGALQAATSTIVSIAPAALDAERLEQRIAAAPTFEETETVVEDELSALSPGEAQEFYAKLTGVVAAYLALLDQVGVDTKLYTALAALTSALLVLWAHMEKHR
jgi:hypothetical protein